MYRKRKRKLHEFGSGDKHKPSKKIKTNNNAIGTKSSSIFKDDQDYKEFVKMYGAIWESKMIKQMSISSDITKEIAEYSTGGWKECGIPSCKQLISLLFEKETYFCTGCNKSVKWYLCDNCGPVLLPLEDEDEYYCEHCEKKYAYDTKVACCGGKCKICTGNCCWYCKKEGEETGKCVGHPRSLGSGWESPEFPYYWR